MSRVSLFISESIHIRVTQTQPSQRTAGGGRRSCTGACWGPKGAHGSCSVGTTRAGSRPRQWMGPLNDEPGGGGHGDPWERPMQRLAAKHTGASFAVEQACQTPAMAALRAVARLAPAAELASGAGGWIAAAQAPVILGHRQPPNAESAHPMPCCGREGSGRFLTLSIERRLLSPARLAPTEFRSSPEDSTFKNSPRIQTHEKSNSA
jgi:hypothetical protein